MTLSDLINTAIKNKPNNKRPSRAEALQAKRAQKYFNTVVAHAPGTTITTSDRSYLVGNDGSWRRI